jgi:hypothetical protein
LKISNNIFLQGKIMQFTTPVSTEGFPFKTGYRLNNLFLGSCFTENIGQIMSSLAFRADINPFGIVYNPVSIARSIKRLVDPTPYKKTDLIFHNGLYHSYMHHGKFSGADADTVLSDINTRLSAGSRFLRETDFLFLTLGTAWIYELRKTGEVVANCHKVPAADFRRFRLTVTETVEVLRDALEALWNIRPGLKVVFTVSPVRHTSDGPSGNQLSKSTLLLAADALVKGFGNNQCAYFPAYEIVMDELRDYRYYAADMAHVSDLTVQYIWQKFSEVALDSESRAVMDKIEAVRKAMAHRPFNRITEDHFKFLENTLSKACLLSENYPYISLAREIQSLEHEMQTIRKALDLP